MRIKNAFAILAISIAALAVSAPAQAAVTIDIQEVGPDVVATTSGSIDLTGLTYAGTGGSIAGVIPSGGLFASTSPVSGFDTYYSIAGPAGFGTGSLALASSWSGDVLLVSGVPAVPALGVPLGYVSGAALSAVTTFAGQTFASLGLTPGTYEFTAPSDAITLTIGSSAPGAVPEPATWAMMLLGFFALGATMRAPRRRTALAA